MVWFRKKEVMSKTEKAIITLLQQREVFMDVEDIFLQLNPGCKRYSYAAVYHSVRTLNQKGAIVSEVRPFERRKYFRINAAWSARTLE